MGQAKIKEAEARIAAAMQARLRMASLQFPDSLECVDIVVVNAKDAAAESSARKALGELPSLLEKHITDQHTMPAGQVGAVVWAKWPEGRQYAAYVRSIEDVMQSWLQLMSLEASVRGYGISVAVFGVESWQEALAAKAGDVATNAIEVNGLIGGEPRIFLLHAGEREIGLEIPKTKSPAELAGILGQTLRTLDKMVATKDALKKHQSSLVLSFSGYDSDPREVWDIPECAHVIQEIHKYAPFWSWLVHPQSLVMWVGALASRGATVVLKDGRVVFPVDMEAVESITEITMKGALERIFFSGLDITTDHVAAERFAVTIKGIEEAAAALQDLSERLESGEMGIGVRDETDEFDDEEMQEESIVDDRSAGLLDLAIAPTGTEIKFGNVQVTDPKTFSQIASITMREMVMLVKTQGKSILESEEDIHTERAWLREDGSLLVRWNSIGLKDEIVVPKGAWRLLEDAELDALTKQALERMPDALTDKMADEIATASDAIATNIEQFERIAATSSGALFIFDKSGPSLLHLKTLAGVQPEVERFADAWLSSPANFLLFYRDKVRGWSMSLANSESDLFELALITFLTVVSDRARTMVLPKTSNLDDKIRRWWKDHGGVADAPSTLH